MMYDNTASNVTNMYRKGKYKCVGQKVDLCWTKIVPPESALLQITFAHVVKQVVCCISPYKFTFHGSLKIECWRLRTFVVCTFTAVEIIASTSLIKNWVFLTTQSKTYPCPSQSWGKPKYFELHPASEKPTYPFQCCNLKNWFWKSSYTQMCIPCIVNKAIHSPEHKNKIHQLKMSAVMVITPFWSWSHLMSSLLHKLNKFS